MATQVSVRLRLIPVSLFTTLVAVLLIGGLLAWNQQRKSRDALRRDAAIQARIIGGNCAAALLFGDAKAAGETLASLRAHPDVRAAAVYDPAGALLASYRKADAAGADAPGKPGADGEVFAGAVLNLTAPIDAEGKRTGTVFLQYDLSAQRARFRGFLLFGAAVAGGALAVAWLLLARLQRSVMAPFQSVAQLMEEVSRGDLTGSVQIAGGGELGRLGESISATIATLREIIGRVDASFLIIERVAENLAQLAEAVAAGARREEEVVGVLNGTTAALSGAADRVSDEAGVLRQSTEKNLASLLELSRSVGVVSGNAENLTAAAAGTMGAIHEMSATLALVEERVSDLTRLLRETAAAMQAIDQAVGQVKDLSFRTRGVAGGLHTLASEQGREAMSRAEEGMAGIKALVASLGERVRGVGRRAQEIDAVVAIVDDIADQTNLLALNAAILAAQAGERGGGFAVVAEEIRGLSRRTEESLQRISALVAGIQEDSRGAVAEVARGIEEVERGARQVGGVGAVLARFVAGAEETSGLSAEIAERADRQAAESARIAAALVEVAAMAEQLLRSAGEQKETSRHILGIAEDTGAKAGLMKRSTEEQLATVTYLEQEAEGTAALGVRLRESAVSSSEVAEKVRDSTRVIAAAVEENRARARSLREAIDRLGVQAQEVRERLSVFRLRAAEGGDTRT